MSSTREDQLLHKLKNCLGPQKHEGEIRQDLKTIKDTYCISKQNPHNHAGNYYKQNEYQNYKSQYVTERAAYRQPLGPSTYNPPLPTHHVHHYQQNNFIHQNDAAKINRSPQRDKPIRRYEYGLGMGLTLKNNKNDKKLPSQQSITIASNTIQSKKAAKNYREQVKQRQYYLQRQDQPPLKNIKPKYQYPFTPQTDRQRNIPQQQTKLKRQEYKSKESKQSFAMSKLNRIAQLNEKINDRIKSIIGVFEDRK